MHLGGMGCGGAGDRYQLMVTDVDCNCVLLAANPRQSGRPDYLQISTDYFHL